MTRLWAAAEAEALGHGGVTQVTAATGILHKRIVAGKRDLAELRDNPPTQAPREQRVRREGAGRKRLEEVDAKLSPALDALIEPVTRGDPMAVNLVAATTTTTGLHIRAAADKKSYKKGIRVSDEQMAKLSVIPDRVRSVWNYRFEPIL